MEQGGVTVSVVSHGQGRLVRTLLDDLDRHCAGACEVILTVNVPEALELGGEGRRHPLRVVENAAPQGFAANHNAAFRSADTPFFCVINPDVRLNSDPFPALTAVLEDVGVGVAAPRVRNSRGAIEDSGRKFPTPRSLCRKALGLASDPPPGDGLEALEPDWVAGMFMLFRSEVFRALGGFDEGYFLYYEDIHLCARLRLDGKRVVLDPGVEIVHDARRESRRRLRHAWWHGRSILRFFRSEAYRELGRRGLR